MKECSAALSALAGTQDCEYTIPLIWVVVSFSPLELNKNLLCGSKRQTASKSRFCQMHMTENQQGKETENSGKRSEVMDHGFLPAYQRIIW